MRAGSSSGTVISPCTSSARGAWPQGATLSAVTAHLSRTLGIGARILPMSEDPVRTRVLTVRGMAGLPGILRPPAVPTGGAGVSRSRAPKSRGRSPTRWQPCSGRTCVPSSSVPPTRSSALSPFSPCRASAPPSSAPRAPVIAVTPIIGGKAIKGPAAKMMAELGLEVSAAAVARRYAGFLDGFVIDTDPMPAPPSTGVRFFSAETLMRQDRGSPATGAGGAAGGRQPAIGWPPQPAKAAPACAGGSGRRERSAGLAGVPRRPLARLRRPG